MNLENYDRELAIGQIMELSECPRDAVLGDVEKLQSLLGFDVDDAVVFLLCQMTREDAILRSLDLKD